MGPKDLIRNLTKSNDVLINTYLADLGDADLLVRPTPGANHIAWQLGHLIKSEQSLLTTAVPNAPTAELPPGWEKQYSVEASHLDSPAGFLPKAKYLEIYQRSRANVLNVLEAFPESDLDHPTPGRLARIAPTLADLFLLIANHPMMHVGQIVVVRRKLGKPIVI